MYLDKVLFPIGRIGVTHTSLFQRYNCLWIGSFCRSFTLSTWVGYGHCRNKKHKLRNILKLTHHRRNRAMNIGNNSPTMSKREKFMNLVKSTKDTYLPTISQTIKQSRSSVWNHSKNLSSSTLSSSYRELPSDMKIVFYPTYSTKKYNRYETRIRFSLQSPGNITSRRNRLLVMLSRQYLKSGSNIKSDLCTALPNSDTDVTSTSCVYNNKFSSGYTSNGESEYFNSIDTDSKELKVLKERLTGFITKNVGNVPLSITTFNKDCNIVQRIISDARGFIDTKIITDFAPTGIKISLDHDQTLNCSADITETFPNCLIDSKGIAIISDIDDTIKHTGVTGDKKSMFRNVFVHSVDSWVIDYVPEWYNNLKRFYNADFFYVSNSPIQLYPVLNDYISKYLPMGPIFLKQYSGNLLSGITTSSADRKLNTLKTIINDFPQKKFVLIGDSGEQDLEAYISIALNYPDQIVAIYIRCCKNSMSDMGLNEMEVISELNDLIRDEYIKPFQDNNKQSYHHCDGIGRSDGTFKQSQSIKPPIPKKTVHLDRKQIDLIKSSRIKNGDINNIKKVNQDNELNDMYSINQGSHTLQAEYNTILVNGQPNPNELQKPNTVPLIKRYRPIPPPLPFSLQKTHSDSELIEFFNNRTNKSKYEPSYFNNNSSINSNGGDDPYMVPSSQNDYNIYSGYFDKKADLWHKRVRQSISQLIEIEKYDIALMFFSDPRDAYKDSVERINNLKN